MDLDIIVLIIFIIFILLLAPILFSPDENYHSLNVVPLFNRRICGGYHRWTKDENGKVICVKCGGRPK